MEKGRRLPLVASYWKCILKAPSSLHRCMVAFKGVFPSPASPGPQHSPGDGRPCLFCHSAKLGALPAPSTPKSGGSSPGGNTGWSVQRETNWSFTDEGRRGLARMEAARYLTGEDGALLSHSQFPVLFFSPY